MKTKGDRKVVGAYPTMFIKIKDLYSKNHDVYEKTGS
jgi:hypothetical protein